VKVDKEIVDICAENLVALRMGDDLGYESGTFLSPELLRRTSFRGTGGAWR